MLAFRTLYPDTCCRACTIHANPRALDDLQGSKWWRASAVRQAVEEGSGRDMSRSSEAHLTLFHHEEQHVAGPEAGQAVARGPVRRLKSELSNIEPLSAACAAARASRPDASRRVHP